MANDEDFENEDDTDENDSSVVKNLRKQAADGKLAEKRAAELERENAFLKAGIPDTKATGYFAKAYDGELTKEAIQAAAAEAGFITVDENDGGVDASEEAAHERVADAGAGAGDSEPPGYAEAVAAAKSPEELNEVLDKFQVKRINT